MLNPESIKKVIGAPLFDSKRLSCCITDYSLKFVYVNEAFINISGYSKEDLLGKSIRTLLDGPTFKRALKQLAKYLLNGSKAPEDWSFVHKNGAIVDTKVEISHIQIEGKKYILSVALDFTKEINSMYRIEVYNRIFGTEAVKLDTHPKRSCPYFVCTAFIRLRGALTNA